MLQVGVIFSCKAVINLTMSIGVVPAYATKMKSDPKKRFAPSFVDRLGGIVSLYVSALGAVFIAFAFSKTLAILGEYFRLLVHKRLTETHSNMRVRCRVCRWHIHLCARKVNRSAYTGRNERCSRIRGHSACAHHRRLHRQSDHGLGMGCSFGCW